MVQEAHGECAYRDSIQQPATDLWKQPATVIADDKHHMTGTNLLALGGADQQTATTISQVLKNKTLSMCCSLSRRCGGA